MISFSKDRDILKYESVLFSDLYFPWQVLCQGSNGTLSGNAFTASLEDFVSCGVDAGGVIYLRTSDGSIDGCFEIVSVESTTELKISVIRADDDYSEIEIGEASDVTYRISTYVPQAREVLFELTRYFGIGPGDVVSELSSDDIVDTEGLKLASVYAVIAGVYATVASKSGGDEGFWEKSRYYQKLFEKARSRCKLSLDTDGDGSVDKIKRAGSIRLVRE